MRYPEVPTSVYKNHPRPKAGMDFAWLSGPSAFVAAAVATAFVFLLWLARGKPSESSTVVGVLLDLVSLPVGAFALLVAVLAGLRGAESIVLPVVLGVAGAVLIGRSLRDVPWVGLVSLGLAGGTAYALTVYERSVATVPVLLVATGLVFVVAYGILGLLSIPFRLIAWGTSARFLSAALAIAAAAVGVVEAVGAGML